MLDEQTHQVIADALWRAESTGTPTPSPSANREWTSKDAYSVQTINALRRAERGDTGIGFRVAATSPERRRELMLDHPIFGILTDAMEVCDRDVLDISQLTRPQVAAELAFVLHSPLEGPGVNVAQVLQATEFVLPALSVTDSRVRVSELTGLDVIADNASSAQFSLGGAPVSPFALDLRLFGAALRKNGRVASTGAGASSMGDPCLAVAWLANKLAEFDEGLAPGAVILSGTLGPLVPVASGDHLRVDLSNIGSCQIRLVGTPRHSEEAA